MKPEVSVIIPNYNHERFLVQRIESVLNQTFQNFEVIILDDYSTDKSREIIDSYRGHSKIKKIIYNKSNSGSPFKQWQKGFEFANGKYVWIAESDDFCDETFLEKALQSFSKNDHSVHYCQSYNVDENNNIINDNFWWTEDITRIDWQKPFFINGKLFIKKALQFKNVIPNASAVVFLKSHFNFKQLEKYKTAGDWLFWISMLTQSDISYSNEILNNFRSHTGSTRNARNSTTQRKFIRRHYEILSIKYKMFNEFQLVDKTAVKEFLNVCIDISSAFDLTYFIKFCNEFKLPKGFIFHFVKRKSIVNRFTMGKA